MLTLRQALYQKNDSGVPLPTVWKSLDQSGIRFMQGQYVLVCAAPGIGKSGFILTKALRSGVPVLYMSADSDEFTQTTRSLSILNGWTLEKSAQMYRDHKDQAVKTLDDSNVWFDFNPSPTLNHIEDVVKATVELMDDYPKLIIIDNITNVISGFAGNDEDPFGGLESLNDYLHSLARDTGACVVGLHHVKGDHNDGNKPIPLSGIKGQISRTPEMILALHRVASEHGSDTLNVSAVKNRSGRGFPSGRSYVSLEFDGASMTIKDFQ